LQPYRWAGAVLSMILRPAADVVRCDDAGACSSLTLPDGWYLIAGSEGRENEAIGPVLHKQYMCDFGGIGTLGDECKRAIPIIFDQLRPELCGGVEAFPRIPAVASPAKANVHLERLAPSRRAAMICVICPNGTGRRYCHGVFTSPASQGWPRLLCYAAVRQARARAAPAYDLTFSSGPGGWHHLAVEGEGRTPTRAHVLRLAKRHGFSEAQVSQMIEAIRASIAEWPRYAQELGVSASRDEITERLTYIDKVFG